jgi:hypothetical protein
MDDDGNAMPTTVGAGITSQPFLNIRKPGERDCLVTS